MPARGWVRVSREIRDSWIYQDDAALRVFLEVLLTVGFTARTWTNNGEQIELERGDVVTSVRAISEATGMARSTVHRALKRLVDRGALKRRAGHSSGHLVGHHATIVSLADPETYIGYSDEGGTPTGTLSGTEVGHPSKEECKKETIPSSSVLRTSSEETSSSEPDNDGSPSRDEIDKTLEQYIRQWNTAAEFIPQLSSVAPDRWSPATKRQFRGFVRKRLKEGSWSWRDVLREVYVAKEFAYKFLTLEWVLRPTNYPKLLQGQYRAENADERVKSIQAKKQQRDLAPEWLCPSCGGPATWNLGRPPGGGDVTELFLCRNDDCDQQREPKTAETEKRWRA